MLRTDKPAAFMTAARSAPGFLSSRMTWFSLVDACTVGTASEVICARAAPTSWNEIPEAEAVGITFASALLSSPKSVFPALIVAKKVSKTCPLSSASNL